MLLWWWWIVLQVAIPPGLAASWWSSGSAASSPSSSSSSSYGSAQFYPTFMSSTVHRFSNLYGTVLHCHDYLLNGQHSTMTMHDGMALPLSAYLQQLGRLRDNKLKNAFMNSNYLDESLDGRVSLSDHNLTITWQARSSGTTVKKFASSSSASNRKTQTSMNAGDLAPEYETALDRPDLRYASAMDGALWLPPFHAEEYVPEVHDSYYRCLLHLPQGILMSRSVYLQAVTEKPARSTSPKEANVNKQHRLESNHHHGAIADDQDRHASEQLYIQTLNSSEVSEGNDAILKCSFNRQNSLYEISSWMREDGKVFLPLEILYRNVQQTLGLSGNTARDANAHSNFVNYTTFRHLILPLTGDLMVLNVRKSDGKHRYRCQVRHKITNARLLSPSWGQIRVKDSSELYMFGPRLNSQLQTRHTLAVNDGETVFFYCSFDGHPTPSIHWLHSDTQSLTPSSASQSSNGLYFAANTESPLNSEGRFLNSNSNCEVSSPYLIGRNFLVIDRVSNEDTGVISCLANNSNSFVRHDMLLFVKSSIQVSMSASISRPYPGQDLALSCNLTTASNSSASFYATHSFNASHVSEQNKRLRSLISSHFLLNTNWYHNGRLINFNHRVSRTAEDQIMIRDFRAPEDNGMYQCSIRLTAPDYDEESFMSALHIRSVEKAPELVSMFSDQINLLDRKLEPVSLKCVADGVPMPRIRWLLDGTELYTNSHVRIESYAESVQSSSSPLSGEHHLLRSTVSYLNISSLLAQDVGIYECVAQNYLGSVSHRARINQMGAPFVKPIANQTAVLGQSFTINCTYGGYPLEEVYFIKGHHLASGDNNHNNNNHKPSGDNGTPSSSSKNNANVQRLPFDERHVVPLLGSITISPVEKSDEGQYRCVVVTSNGERAQQLFHLKVVVGPVISPIVFSNNLEEGMRGSAVCTVTSGDPPIHISWYKDGLRLPERGIGVAHRHHSESIFDFVVDQIQIVSINDFMSSLVISNISRYHQGVYTCVASSPVATTNVSAHLTVRAAPRWRLKPADHHAMAGESLTLNCQSSGQPQPITRWKFARMDVSYGNEPVPILSSQHVHVLENGSLHLLTLEPKHSGIYICDTSNAVNKDTIEWRARVEIYALPKVIIQNTLGKSGDSKRGSNNNLAFSGGTYRVNAIERVVLRKGAQTQLMCAAVGIQSPVSVEWLRPQHSTSEDDNNNNNNNNNNVIHKKRSGKTLENSHTDTRVVLREETKLNEKRVYLYISHVNRHDSGVYACLATNTLGQSIAFIEVLVQEAPDPPIDLRAQEISSRSVTLAWTLEYNGHSPIKTYLVKYWRHTDTDNNQIKTVKLDHANKLEPDSVKSLSNLMTINGLSSQSTYEFKVCAINEFGASSFTDPLVITTEMEAPSVIPQELKTMAIDSRSIRLTWSVVMALPAERIDGFYIGYRHIHSIENTDQRDKSDGSSSMPTYTFKTMYGYNKLVNVSRKDSHIHTSQASDNNNVTTFCEVLSLPDEINQQIENGSNMNRQQQQHRFTHPQHKNLDKPDEQVRCTYEFIVNGLSRMTKLGLVVQAFNAKGAGPTSSEIYAQTLPKDPPAKFDIRLINVTSYEATFVWHSGNQIDLSDNEHNNDDSNNNNNNNMNIDGYIISYRATSRKYVFESSAVDPVERAAIERNNRMANMKLVHTDGWETYTLASKVSSYTLRNLRCGTNYRVKVEAFNEMGNGVPSDILDFSTIGRTPIPPSSTVFIHPNISFALFDLDRWADGLCPIQHFALKYRFKDFTKKSDPMSGWITASTHIKSEYGFMYMLRDLLPGTWYELSVIATNEAGETEARFLFATLTLSGATVEPVYEMDSYNRRRVGSMIGGVITPESILEDPMILIPTTCAILVLLVVFGATAFIFVTRSKEAATLTEPHFCRHRENSRNDQLSLNSLSKNYSKSDFMPAYEIEPLKYDSSNCTQADQYVVGPVAYLESKLMCGDGNDLLTDGCLIATPEQRTCQQQSRLLNNRQEALYSTPCIPGKGQPFPNNAQLDKINSYGSTQLTNNDQEQASNESSLDESVYGDLINRAKVPQSSFMHHPPSATYFVQTHHVTVDTGKRDRNHIYELPKQNQAPPQQRVELCEQNESDFIRMMQPSGSGCGNNSLNQIPLQSTKVQASPHLSFRPEQNVPNIHNFKQNY